MRVEEARSLLKKLPGAMEIFIMGHDGKRHAVTASIVEVVHFGPFADVVPGRKESAIILKEDE